MPDNNLPEIRKIKSLEKLATHSSQHKEKVNYDEGYVPPEYSPEYHKVFQFIDNGSPLIFVTGKAGTGKSTLINEIKRKYKGQTAVVAPTGVAALNVGGQTIHSLFRFAPEIINLNSIKEIKENQLFKILKIIIIDEISMVRVDLIEGIDKFLRLNGPDRKLPFGGIQMMFFGDLFQLPPVVGKKREERTYFARNYKSNFFFSAKALANMKLAAVELQTVHRQSETGFVDLLSRIRLNQCTEQDFRFLNDRNREPPGENRPAILTGNRTDAKRINQDELANLPGPEKLYLGTVFGQFDLEDRDSYPAPERLILKRNARVMFTKNDSAKRWVNGSFGTVREIQDDKVIVELDGGMKSIVDVQEEKWDQYKLTYDSEQESVIYQKIGSYLQIPLSPAWAITIHKSQGQTLDGVQIDLGESGAFSDGQTYVALSRARSLDGVWLRKPIRENDIRVDEKVVAFYREVFTEGKAETTSSSNFVFPDLPAMTAGTEMIPASSNQTKRKAAKGLKTNSPTPKMEVALSDEKAYEIVDMAINDASSIEIEYINGRGNISHRVIRPRVWINDQRFTAYCELREREQDFVIGGIQKATFLD